MRQVMDDGPSDAAEMDDLAGGRGGRALSSDPRVEDLLRELAPQVLGIARPPLRRLRRRRGRRAGGAASPRT